MVAYLLSLGCKPFQEKNLEIGILCTSDSVFSPDSELLYQTEQLGLTIMTEALGLATMTEDLIEAVEGSQREISLA